MKVVLTGATGFVGAQILKSLTRYDTTVIGRTRPASDNCSLFYEANIDSHTNYESALVGADVLIHAAARVHIMHDKALDPITAYKEVNTFGTINLARQAAKAGLKRFIFISSIKVNGENTNGSEPFKATDEPCPQDPYGISKNEAEKKLKLLSEETGMEIVIIRPPLVYGPGVKANFATMMRLLAKGIPLPFGGLTDNKRSLVSVYNLVDLILNCVNNPNAANRTFLVSDDHDVSTTELLKELGSSLGKGDRLFTVPVKCFRIMGRVTQKSDVVERLCGSLQVDISKTKELLDWTPPMRLKEGFSRTTQFFLSNK